MTHGMATASPHRKDRTIILPIMQDEYENIVLAPAPFRSWIDEQYRLHPEIFPSPFTGFSKDDLKEAYGVFAMEAKEVEPEYAPKTR
jgi:hypothetical protein